MVLWEGELASNVTDHSQWPDTPPTMILILSHLAFKLSTRITLKTQRVVAWRRPSSGDHGEHLYSTDGLGFTIHTYICK